MIEEMLPVTECDARIVESELEVSEEMVDSGRGINSRVSENPTLGRGPVEFRFGELWIESEMGSIDWMVDALDAGLSPKVGGALTGGHRGDVGRLPARLGVVSGLGLNMNERS